MKQTQKDRLRLALRDGRWHSNFSLASRLYGNRPCGRLGARIWDLQREGYMIESSTEHRRFGKTKVPARHWYRMV